jgi:hypothetical protein
MPDTFNTLYREALKDIFLELAQQQLEQGADALTCADAYAEQGKPDFTLAYLLLIEASDDVKRAILARAYEQRASIAEGKAREFSARFHRSFPMIKEEVQKDRTAAQQIRQGERMQREKSAPHKPLPISIKWN